MEAFVSCVESGADICSLTHCRGQDKILCSSTVPDTASAGFSVKAQLQVRVASWFFYLHTQLFMGFVAGDASWQTGLACVNRYAVMLMLIS